MYKKFLSILLAFVLILMSAPFTVMAAPSINLTVGINKNTKPVLSWTAVDDAEEYVIYRTYNGRKYKYNTVSADTTTYTNNTVSNHITYTYQVAAVINGSESIYSNEADFTIISNAIDLTVKLNNSRKPVLKWTAVDDAEEYIIYRTYNGRRYEYNTVSGNTTTYTNYSVTEDVDYTYEVAAVVDDKCYISKKAQIKIDTALIPELEVELNEEGKPVLSWTPVEGADWYVIYRSYNGKRYAYNTVRNGKTTYTNNTVTNSVAYTYEVAASVKSVEQPASNAVRIVVETLIPTLSVDTSSGKPVLSWDPIENASEYIIYRSYSGRRYKYNTVEGNKTSYTNNSFTSGTYYTYEVAAVVNKKEYVSIAVYVLAPYPSVAPVASGSVGSRLKLSWTKVAGASGYNVYRYVGNEWKFYIDMAFNDSYIYVASAEPGTTYTFKVSSIVNGKEAFSNIVEMRLPVLTPYISVKQNGDNHLVLKWDAVDDAENYIVYRVDDGEKQELATINDATYTDSDVIIGNTYTYVVIAIVNGDERVSNEASSFVAPNEPILSVKLNVDAKPVLTWTANSNAENYVIYRSYNGNRYKYHTVPSSTTTYTNNTVTWGTTYTYEVAAVVDGEELLGESVDISIPTKLYIPAPTATLNKNNDVDITFQAVEGAKYYCVYRNSTPYRFNEKPGTVTDYYVTDIYNTTYRLGVKIGGIEYPSESVNIIIPE